IMFYDTAPLTLSKQGVLFRSRQGAGSDDVTVKLRPMTEARVAGFAAQPGFKCELDTNVGSAGTASCSLTSDMDGHTLAASLKGNTIGQLWSDNARKFARVVAQDLDVEALHPLGPISSVTWTIKATEIGEDVSFERWDVPGGKRTLEASIKVKTS